MSGSVRSSRCAEHAWNIGAASRRADEVLSPTDERRLLKHLAACPSCLEAAVAEDPALFFVPLARSFTPERSERSSASAAREGKKMASDVLAVIDSERLDRRLRPPRLLLKVAAVVLAGAGLAGLLLIRHGGNRPPAGEAAAAAAAADASTAMAATTAPLIEEVACRDAKIYQFASEAPGQPSVVFVVDRNADL